MRKATTAAAAEQQPVVGNLNDVAYISYLKRVGDRFAQNAEKAALFTTDAFDLWEFYIRSYPESIRQYHTCNACRKFIERYGSLVTIDEHGSIAPALWHVDDIDGVGDDALAVAAMVKRLSKASVTGVFLSSDLTWGQPVTGAWTHLHLFPTKAQVFKKATQNAGQAMAEKLEDFKNVFRALEEFTPPMIAQALSLLKSDALYGSEKVLGQAQWLADLHSARTLAGKGRSRANVVWRAIATAPAGFCHPRSSMIGTLLEDLAAGLPFADVSRKFKEKMHPLQYQRPQAPPSAGNIAQAEKVIAQLNAAGALDRRYARVEEVDALWRPPVVEAPKSSGVFGHLKPKESPDLQPMDVLAGNMTWEKFRRTVMKEAQTIEALIPAVGDFTAIVTAANAEAPPILQWDLDDKRNPFSWYLYPGGSPSFRWGVQAGAWVPVTAITLRTNDWFGMEGKYPHHLDGAVFLLTGAKDAEWMTASACLFPSILKAEFHGIRTTIEAYSRTARLAGYDEATACGLGLQKGTPASLRVRVTDPVGTRMDFLIDRWD